MTRGMQGNVIVIRSVERQIDININVHVTLI